MGQKLNGGECFNVYRIHSTSISSLLFYDILNHRPISDCIDNKMPSVTETEILPESSVQRLDLTVEPATAQGKAGAFAPQPTRETKISAFVP